MTYSSRELRILYLTDSPIDTIGGSQISTLTLANSMRDILGARIAIYSPQTTEPKSELLSGLELFSYRSTKNHIPPPYKAPVNFYKALEGAQNAFRSFKPDIVHSQNSVSILINSWLKKFGQREGKRVISFHTDRSLREGYRFPMKIINKLSVNNLDCVITTTQKNAGKWRLLSPNAVEVIPNFPSSYFNVYEPEKASCLSQEREFVIGFAGRMTAVKNWPLAEAVIKELNNVRQDFYVHIAISTNKANCQELEQTRNLKERFFRLMGKRCRFYEDLSQKEMADFYYPIDLFLLTSSFESFGRTAVEAMSRKCCVLGTNVGGIPEVLEDSSLICEQESTDFVKKILYFMERKELLKAKQEQLYSRFLKHFSSHVIAKKQSKLYLSYLEEGRVPIT